MLDTDTPRPAPAAPALPEPGDRLLRRVWIGYLTALVTLALYAVTVPTLAALYDVSVPVAFLVAAAHVAALPLTLVRPNEAVGFSAVVLVATALLTAGAAGPPWPLPVTTMVTQLLICLAVSVRGDVALAIASVALSLGAAAAPVALESVSLGEVPGATENLVTFGSIAALVSALALVGARLLRSRDGVER